MGSTSQAWNDFFASVAGAAAALAGLLFVSISINLARILKFKHLPDRALEALLAFFSVLIIATLALVPGLSPVILGLEIGLTGLAAWAFQTWALLQTFKADFRYTRYPIRVVMNQLPPIPFIVAGAMLLSGNNGGIYWVVPGILFSFASGVFGAWVLLVEIQR